MKERRHDALATQAETAQLLDARFSARHCGHLLKAIDEDLDLGDHMDDAVKSLRIVVAADESVKSGQVVQL
jgi:hypothetical protein